jgi:HEAT repeat protein
VSVPPDVTRRRETVARAGHAGDAATARAHLGDPDGTVRATALRALQRSGALDDATVATALVDPDPVVRRGALALAASRPGVALLAALDDADDSVREQAAWACGERAEVAPPEAAVVGRLAALAVDTTVDHLVREAAVAALGAIGDPRGLNAVLHALAHDRATVRRRAVLALAPFDGPAVDAALQAALTDRDLQVRQAAEDISADG